MISKYNIVSKRFVWCVLLFLCAIFWFWVFLRCLQLTLLTGLQPHQKTHQYICSQKINHTASLCGLGGMVWSSNRRVMCFAARGGRGLQDASKWGEDFYVRFSSRCLPNALATRRRVDNLISPAWFSSRDMAVFFV